MTDSPAESTECPTEDCIGESRSVWLVFLSNYDDHGGAIYRTESAAEAAKEWFEQNASGSVFIFEMPVNDGFAPPESFYGNYLSWGYENAE